MTTPLAVPDNVAARHDLEDGSTLWRLTTGEWLIDVPALGRHPLIAADSLAPEWPTGGES